MRPVLSIFVPLAALAVGCALPVEDAANMGSTEQELFYVPLRLTSVVTPIIMRW